MQFVSEIQVRNGLISPHTCHTAHMTKYWCHVGGNIGPIRGNKKSTEALILQDISFSILWKLLIS